MFGMYSFLFTVKIMPTKIAELSPTLATYWIGNIQFSRLLFAMFYVLCKSQIIATTFAFI